MINLMGGRPAGAGCFDCLLLMCTVTVGYCLMIVWRGWVALIVLQM
jgi:hypothetical protein